GAVTRREQHPVRVCIVDRDRNPGREPAARLPPRAAGVVRDRERRTAVDDGDDGRARCRSGDDAWQRHADLLGLERVRVADHLLRLEVDGERPFGSVHRGGHDTLRSSIALTSAVARRAADTGVTPTDLPARYAAEKASPEPVGSEATGQAPTRSQRPW